MEIHINSAEIRLGMFLKWSYEEHTPGRKNMVNAASDAPIHEDLAEAFQKLLPHMLLVGEFKQKSELIKAFDLGTELPEDITNKYKVQSFSMEEKNGEYSVKITGVKHLATGKKLPIQPPKIQRGTGENEYEFFTHLLAVCEDIRNEISEFMDGKMGTRAQAAMDFGDDDDFVPEMEGNEAA